MEKIPTDNHIRDMLDPVAPAALFGMFDRTLAALEAGGGLCMKKTENPETRNAPAQASK